MSSSPICQVRNGGGSYVDTPGGVDVTAGFTISIKLKTPGPVTSWALEVFGTDELSTPPTLSNVDPITHEVVSPTTEVSFTWPGASGDGRAIGFKSVVDGGVGVGTTTTFGCFSLATNNARVGFVGQTREGDPNFGWTTLLNPLLRASGGGGGGGGGSSPTIIFRPGLATSAPAYETWGEIKAYLATPASGIQPLIVVDPTFGTPVVTGGTGVTNTKYATIVSYNDSVYGIRALTIEDGATLQDVLNFSGLLVHATSITTNAISFSGSTIGSPATEVAFTLDASVIDSDSTSTIPVCELQNHQRVNMHMLNGAQLGYLSNHPIIHIDNGARLDLSLSGGGTQPNPGTITGDAGSLLTISYDSAVGAVNSGTIPLSGFGGTQTIAPQAVAYNIYFFDGAVPPTTGATTVQQALNYLKQVPALPALGAANPFDYVQALPITCFSQPKCCLYDGSTLWVTNFNNASLLKIDTSTTPPSLLTTIDLSLSGTYPFIAGFKISSDSTHLAVATYNGGRVIVVDKSSNTVVGVGNSGYGTLNVTSVLINPDNEDDIFVMTNDGAGGGVLHRYSKATLISSFPTEGTPDIVSNPYGSSFDAGGSDGEDMCYGGGSLFLTTGSNATLYQVNTTTLNPGATFADALNQERCVYAFGSVWVTTGGAQSVRRFDPTNIALGPIALISTGAYTLNITADDTTIWTDTFQDGAGNQINRISTGLGSEALIATVGVDYGAGTWGLAFDNNTPAIWVVDALNNQLIEVAIGLGSETVASTWQGPLAIRFVTESIFPSKHYCDGIAGLQQTAQTTSDEKGAFIFDPSAFYSTGRTGFNPSVSHFRLAAILECGTSGQTCTLELFDISDGVLITTLTTSATVPTLVTATLGIAGIPSTNFLPNSEKLYGVRIKRTGGTTSDFVTCKMARIEVTYT